VLQCVAACCSVLPHAIQGGVTIFAMKVSSIFMSCCIRIHMCDMTHTYMHDIMHTYRVAAESRLNEFLYFFCKIVLFLVGSFPKVTCYFLEPRNCYTA